MNGLRWVFYLAIPLLGLAASTAAEEPKSGGGQMEFPDIKGFTRSQPNHLPNPQHGYIISYQSDRDLMINVYVYNSSLERIPDGATSSAVKEEIMRIELGLETLKRQGMYNSYKERVSGEVRVGNWPKAPHAQRRLFEIDRVDVGRILTDVYITGYKNHFIKIRFSYPIDKQVESEKAVTPVLTALGKMMTS
jgi:hypothetical protein